MDKTGDNLYISDMETISPPARILTSHYTHCSPDWGWDSKNTKWQYLIMWCVTKGRGTLETMGEKFDLRAGDCFALRMWHRVIGKHDPENPLSVLWAHFCYETESGKVVRLSDSDEFWLPVLHRRLIDPPFFNTLFERAIDQVAADGEGTPAANRWMDATLLELARQDRFLALHGRERVQAEAIYELCSRIRKSPECPWRVEELAGEMHYTPDHFRRVFMRVVGVKPAAFIIQARIDAAKSLLLLSDHTIGEIAGILGYKDIYHFSRQFKVVTGISPSRYRVR